MQRGICQPKIKPNIKLCLFIVLLYVQTINYVLHSKTSWWVLCLKENLQLGFVYFSWKLISLIWYYPEIDIPYAIILTKKADWIMNIRSCMSVCCIFYDQSLKLRWLNYAVYMQCPCPGPSSAYSFFLIVRDIDSWENWSLQFIAGTRVICIRCEDSLAERNVTYTHWT